MDREWILSGCGMDREWTWMDVENIAMEMGTMIGGLVVMDM